MKHICTHMTSDSKVFAKWSFQTEEMIPPPSRGLSRICLEHMIRDAEDVVCLSA